MAGVWGRVATVAALALCASAAWAQVMEAEQSAPPAAPTAKLVDFRTAWPDDAPQTANGALMAPAVEQLRARFSDPAWTPKVTLAHGPVVSMPRKTVEACGALHDLRLTTSGAPHHIQEYRGAAKWCAFNPLHAPAKVAGLILYGDGRYWLGEVGGTQASAFPMPSGPGEAAYPNGMRVLGVASPVLSSDRGRGVETFGFSATERVIFPTGAMRAASLNAAGDGQGELRWPDGRVFRGAFKDRKPGQGELTFASGASIIGQFSGASEEQPPTFAGAIDLTLPKPEGAFPQGSYRVSAAGPLSDYRALLTVNAIPTRETLGRAPPRSPACPAPTLLPEGWIVWSGGCRGGANPRIVVYAPDARSFIDEQPRADMPFRLISLRANGEVTRIVRARAFTTDARPAPLGEAELMGARNRMAYRGEFLGQIPNGPGLCATPAAEGGGEEPCFYAQGARTDEVHLARREAAQAARELAAAEAAAQREASARAAAQQRAAEARARAQEQADQAQRDYERQMARLADEEEDAAGSGVNPIYEALMEVQGKFAGAAADLQSQRAETDAMQRRIETQQRARQAEQSRQQAEQRAEQARQAVARDQQAASAAQQAERARQVAAQAALARTEALRAARERADAARLAAAEQARANTGASSPANRPLDLYLTVRPAPPPPAPPPASPTSPPRAKAPASKAPVPKGPPIPAHCLEPGASCARAM